MFRKIALALLTTALLPSAFAARRLTVDQLQDALAASHNKPDAELAWQIADFEMSQRISATRLTALMKDLPGDQSRRSLIALADESRFLDLPPAEIPPAPAPLPQQQRQMMSRTLAYIANVIPQLPNFFATRSTVHYVDTPSLYDINGNIAVRYQPLHVTGTTTRRAMYRDGKEVADEDVSQASKASVQGLRSSGEFGPLLSIVMLDAAKGKAAWSHWEQAPGGLVAVYSYSVPQISSHYEVDYCCVADSEHTHLREFKKIVGYHGEIAADSATGAITRLTLELDLKSSEDISQGDILVDYGPVEIGGKTYTCPVRSLALSKVRMALRDGSQVGSSSVLLRGRAGGVATAVQTGVAGEGPTQTLLNDVTFIDYHVFRGEARMLAANEPGAATPGVADSVPTPAPSDATTAPAGTTATASSSPDSDSPTPAVAAPRPAPPPPPEPAEFSVTPATGLPGTTPVAANSDQGLTLHTTARLVDVDAVVYDRKGHPITDLKQSDFQILDDGRPQTIRSFAQAASAAAATALPAQPAAAEAAETNVQPIFTNRPAESQPAAQASTILLIDAGSLAFPDIGWAREELLRFLKTTQPNERVGLYILRTSGLQILSEPTTDHNQLAALLTQWKPSMQDLGNAQEAEERNRQHIDEVHKPGDLFRVNGNTDAEDPDGGTQPMDPQLRDFGSNPAGDALLGLLGVARHLSPVAGHKSLVWVSSDNVLADWTGATGGNPQIQTAILRTALRAQEAMNDAHVSVYPLDASQLEGGAITAEMQHRNVELNQAARDNTSLGGGGGGVAGGGAAQGEDASTNRNMTPGRIKAEMQQDLHAIQPDIQQLATATGGRALRRAGDISHELDGIVADGRAVYMLSFTPDTQPDGKYHHLTLKVAGRRDASMRYRNGYLYAVEPTSLKDRFQQALWQPADSTELTVVATPLAGKDGPELHLNIAGTLLQPVQKDDRYVGQLDVFFMQTDGSGGHARIAGQTLHLDLKPGTYQDVLRDGVPFKQNLVLRPNLSSLRVLVVDENSGRIGSVTIPASALE